MTISVQDIPFEVLQMILKDCDIGPREFPDFVDLNHYFFRKLFFLERHDIGISSRHLDLGLGLHNTS